MANLTDADRAQMAYNAGFRGDALNKIVAISIAEDGSGDPNIVNNIGATGILQFMPGTWSGLVAQGKASGSPTDPQAAFNAAYALSNGGTNFSDWETFTVGAFQNFLSRAQQAAAGITGATSSTLSNNPVGAIGDAITSALNPMTMLKAVASQFNISASDVLIDVGMLAAGVGLVAIGAYEGFKKPS